MKMKKTQSVASKALLSVAGFAAFGLTLTPPSAEAVPAFARQMGMQCSMCHSVAFPALNSFGRAFKASGYTMTGAQPQIKGDGIALPSTLNVSMISKLRYVQSAGDSNIVWPDEQGLLIGGKVSDGIGALVENALVGGAVEGTVNDETDPKTGKKTIGGKSNTALGYKIVFEAAKMGNTRVSIVPFSTDALGPGYGMELLNTGAQRSQRMIEDRNAYSASNVLGIGSGASTGLTVAITDPAYFVNVAQYSPGHWNTNTDANITDLATYFRAAVTPRLGGFDTGFGVQMITGEVTNNAGDKIKQDGYVVDAQAEGKVAGHNFAAYLSYGSAKESSTVSVGNGNAKTTTNIGLLMGIVPNVNGYFAARSSKYKDFGDTKTVGVAWLMRQNMKFELWQSMPNGKDATTTLQMFTAW